MVSTTLALGVTTLTLATFTLLGLWYSRGRVDSLEQFVSARDSAGTGATTATLIASVMGAWILFSPAEAGAAFGGIPAILGYAIGSAIPLLLFIPIGARIRELMPAGHTLTEYVLARYGPWMYGYVLVISVFYMFIFLAAEMTGIALALSLVAGVPQWQTAALIGGFVLVYTAYGGLVASIFTDTIQTLVILPLLAVGFGGALFALGGTGEVHATTVASNPDLLNPGYLAGVEFGIYVVFAIIGANLLNQGMWQRVYASKDTATLQRSFGVAAVAVVPMVLLAGLFGVAAAGMGLIEGGNASIAFFLVAGAAFPEWVLLVVVVLAVLLVMSSADTMFNAIASIVTADLARLLDDPSGRTLSLSGRALTVVVALGAILIGAQGYSVLELFLTADLLAAATVVPFLYGLYSTRLTQGSAVVAALAGLVVGVSYFPPLRGVLAAVPGLADVLPAPSFLVAFVGATVISALVTVVADRLVDAEFEHATLGAAVRSLDDPMTDGGREEEQ
ncbi:sodium:proline symporter [Natronoarchaeum sp. GCM10025703]|uniref:sodium:solute symporter family transporter n=1 Tax=unclassified Natronoarchaeum TaxID=2620183 RepID=UPI003620B1CA